MTWISIKTGVPYKKKKRVCSVCFFCGVKYMKEEYTKKERPNIFCSKLCGIKNYHSSKVPKVDTTTPEEKRLIWKIQKAKQRMKNKTHTVKVKEIKQKVILPSSPTERQMWNLFWDYHLPRISYEHFRGKKGRLPKDQFELATYKICELKFNTERFTSKHAKEYVVHYIGLSLEERAKMGMH